MSRATAFSYQRADYVNPAHPYSGGAIYSTAEDLTLWATALQKGTLVSRLALREGMFERVRLANGEEGSYGYGWMIGDAEGHRVAYHPGHLPGYLASLYHWPDERLSVIGLANCRWFNDYQTCYRIGRLVLGHPTPARRAVALSDEALDKAVGRYEGRGCTFEFVRSGAGLVAHWRTPQRVDKWRRVGRSLLPLSERTYYQEESPQDEVWFDGEDEGLFTTFSFINVIEPYQPYVAHRVRAANKAERDRTEDSGEPPML